MTNENRLSASSASSGPSEPLITPVFLAREAGAPLVLEREPRVFYVLASNGLFLVRNHDFFRSSVPAPSCPSELAEFAGSFEPRFPRIPQLLFERIVGFFAAVAEAHGAEAGVLLCWDPEARSVHALAPPQVATVSGGARARAQPVGLHYEIPAGLPPTWLVFGDVHSHAHLAAFASATDRHDELQRPGLHIIVGEIQREPPGFHVEAVVDEQRFALALEDVIEGYERRQPSFPLEWLAEVRIADADEYPHRRPFADGWNGAAPDAREERAIPNAAGDRAPLP